MADEKYEYLEYMFNGAFLMPGKYEHGLDLTGKVAYSVRVFRKELPQEQVSPEPVPGDIIPEKPVEPSRPEQSQEPLFTLYMRVPMADIRGGSVKFEHVRNSAVRKVKELIDSGTYRPGAEYLCDLLDLEGGCTLNEM